MRKVTTRIATAKLYLGGAYKVPTVGMDSGEYKSANWG